MSLARNRSGADSKHSEEQAKQQTSAKQVAGRSLLATLLHALLAACFILVFSSA
jgi:hypothetical protein